MQIIHLQAVAIALLFYVPLRVMFSGSLKLPSMLSHITVATAKLHDVPIVAVVPSIKHVVNVELELLHLPQFDST